MGSDVVNNAAGHRFELAVDGSIAAAYYELAPGVITFTHTEVPKELGGRGIGSRLVWDALAQVRRDGLKVVPRCPFVKAYLDKHPEQADLA
ncbi:GNAT family N-acetyltransferase [Bradyrhizobium sp. WD16]|uniref:GNAT family N-acetyltransferase n=1 Tax=Bradyrhizobium sp. WD16 TaxID=1521768 RepID=UPI0020A59D15|nr:GNAT family N-acetyltransferase [Bradyrhizobium sp. WD16]UTD29065.1 N-acetyltransferase [Bradyrhizobium sp. WD16]